MVMHGVSGGEDNQPKVRDEEMGRLRDLDGGGGDSKLQESGSRNKVEQRLGVHRQEQEVHWTECHIMQDGYRAA